MDGYNIGLFQRKSKQGGGLGYTFLIIPPTFPWNFSFFYFTPGKNFRQQNKAQPLAIFHKIVLDSLEIPRSKTKIPGNSTLFFLCYPWKFHVVFNYALPCGPVPTKIL